MGLFSTAIMSFCIATAPGQYNNACNSAVDAGTRQAGVRQQFDAAEEQTSQYVAKKAESVTPKTVQKVAGAGFFLYRTAQDKKVNFNLPTLGLADSLSNEITPNSYLVTFKWSL